MKSTLFSFIALILFGLNLSAQTYNGSESVEFDAHILALEASQCGLKLALEEVNNQRPIILQMLLP